MPETLKDLINRDSAVVCRSLDDIGTEDIRSVEGQAIPDAGKKLSMKVLMATPHVIVLRAIRRKGMTDPQHKHDDHDTVSTLVSGHLTVHIGDEKFDAKPGATWRHRPGVKHWSETHEDSVVIEIKTPPTKTW
jgi:quercetin dioxygenase-like cupin family protein